jgi:hypothetical protein
MDENIQEQINLWLLAKRERFTRLLNESYEIQALPLHLNPSTIDINVFLNYINYSIDDFIFKNHSIEDYNLFKIYSSIFPYLSIEFNSIYNWKLFVYFYRMSINLAPTKEEWYELINNETQLEEFKTRIVDDIFK